MIFEKVRDIIVKELNVSKDKVTLETHLIDDLGADSLDAVSLLMAIEDEFNIEISDDEVQNMKKVADLINCIEKAKK